MKGEARVVGAMPLQQVAGPQQVSWPRGPEQPDGLQAHADLLALSTEDDLVAAIVRFNALRKERRRVARAAAALP